jgi:hypothetical protein
MMDVGTYDLVEVGSNSGCLAASGTPVTGFGRLTSNAELESLEKRRGRMTTLQATGPTSKI